MPVILPGQTDIYALTDARLSCGRTLETVVSALLGAGSGVRTGQVIVSPAASSTDGSFSEKVRPKKSSKTASAFPRNRASPALRRTRRSRSAFPGVST